MINISKKHLIAFLIFIIISFFLFSMIKILTDTKSLSQKKSTTKQTKINRMKLTDLQTNAKLNSNFPLLNDNISKKSSSNKRTFYNLMIKPNNQFIKNLRANNYKLLSTLKGMDFKRPPMKINLQINF